VVVNSGNANAATGRRGLEDAARMQGAGAMVAGVPEDRVAIASTGVIGVHLPMEVIERGVEKIALSLARQRLQYEAAVQQAQMLQEQGAQATQQAEQAQAEAEQARKLAAAQSRAAALARKEARLAEAATKALQGGGSTQSNGARTGSLQLSSASFSGDSNDLTAAGRRRVADFARAHPNQRIVVEPRASSSERVLAGRRAVAVQAALVAAGAEKVTVWKVASATSGTEIEVRAQ